MLKQNIEVNNSNAFAQPPSGGCVLKLISLKRRDTAFFQPPSGGCVLKLKESIGRRDTPASRLRAAVC